MRKILILAVLGLICSCANTGSGMADMDYYPRDDYPQVSAQTETVTLVEYKIGDIGPAGGIIFYDKRSNADGWRYLEAAPQDAEFLAAWSAHGTYVGNTKTVIGSGKQNTYLIIDKFSQTGVNVDTAAQKSYELNLNGFDDWFLPSHAELDQLYGNLKRRNIGGFKDELYWASDDADNEGKTTVINFWDGSTEYSAKENENYVRPIRQVPGPNPVPTTAKAVKSGGLLGGNSSKGTNIIVMLLLTGGVIALMLFFPSAAAAD